MPAFATFAQFQTRYERVVDSCEEARVTALLEDASDIIRARVPRMEDPPPGAVVGVVCAMVARVARNPDGKRSETIDDYSYTRDNSVATGELVLTDAERALLSPTGSGAFSITPYSGLLEDA